jgi:tetratricopeptide (TPR) repeat protein
MFVLMSFPFAERPAAGQTTPAGWNQIQNGLNLFHQHDNTRAVNALEPLLANAVSENNAEAEALVSALLGPVYQKLGRFLDAETSMNRSIALWTRLKGDNALELVGPMANLGALYFDAGRYSRAETLIARALEIDNSFPGHFRARAMLMTNLGSVYFTEHKDELAEEKCEEALREFAPMDPGTGWDYAILGAVRLRAGRFEEAESALLQALSIWKAQSDPVDPRVGNGLANLAVFYSVTNRPEKAEPLFEQADAIFRKGGSDLTFVRQARAEYAKVEKSLGHKREAKRLEKEVEKMSAVSAEAVMTRNIVDVSSFMAR